jgi:hypothetical protein
MQLCSSHFGDGDNLPCCGVQASLFGNVQDITSPMDGESDWRCTPLFAGMMNLRSTTSALATTGIAILKFTRKWACDCRFIV